MRKPNFKTALNKCLDLTKDARPLMQSIWYDDYRLYATDGKVLATVPAGGVVPEGIDGQHAFSYDKTRREMYEVPINPNVDLGKYVSAFKRMLYLPNEADKHEFYGAAGPFVESVFYTQVVRGLKKTYTLNFDKFKLAFSFGMPIAWAWGDEESPIQIYYDDPRVNFVVMPIRM